METPSDLYEVYKYGSLGAEIYDIQHVLGESWFTKEFDKSRYTDPTYLSFCRWWVAEVMRMDIESRGFISDMNREWNLRMGVRSRGKFRGLLWHQEVKLIEEGLYFPIPWSPKRCRSSCPPKSFDSFLGTLFQTIFDVARSNCLVGLASGCFDFLHMGHIKFLNECTLRLMNICRSENKRGFIFILFVDDNRLISADKGNHRPLRGFPERIGTLSEIHNGILTDLPLPAVTAKIRVGEFVTLPIGIESLVLDESIIGEVADELSERIQSEPMLDGFNRYVAPNLLYFFTKGDLNERLKEAWINLIGGRAVILPKYTSLSTTKFESVFDLKQERSLLDRFGVDPWWVEMYKSF